MQINFYLKSLERDDDVVIRDSHIEYFLPVTSDFTAVTSLPDSDALMEFQRKMSDKGRSRMDLVIEIHQDEKLALRLTGTYVALEKRVR